MGISYKIGHPGNLGLQGQVSGSIDRKIESCSFICIAYSEDIPVGIGAIKQIYKTPFVKAGIPDLISRYNYELGYIYVVGNEEFRGRGIATSICAELLEILGAENVFATTDESSNNPMKFILNKIGFEKAGNSFRGSKAAKTLDCFS